MKVQGNKYSVFIVSGRGKHRRESGEYTAIGDSYKDAVSGLAEHWNICSLVGPRFGVDWRVSYKAKKGMPKSHAYMKDEKGNTLLLVKRNY